MDVRFSRTRSLLGKEAMEKLAAASVAVFGAGGVGGHAIEALARSGIGAIDVFDGDVVDVTNINRQALAADSTVGMPKVEAALARIKDINPRCKAGACKMFYLPENADAVDLSAYACVIDAVDTMAAKLELIKRCDALGVPLVCCTGAANKTDPAAFRAVDIYETHTDPLARIIRAKCRQMGIERLATVFSAEKPVVPAEPVEPQPGERRSIPASCAFAPAAAGLVAASAAVSLILHGRAHSAA